MEQLTDSQSLYPGGSQKGATWFPKIEMIIWEEICFWEKLGRKSFYFFHNLLIGSIISLKRCQKKIIK